MMNADIEALVLSGELFNPSSSRSSSPRRSPSPDAGWHDELLNDTSDSEARKPATNGPHDPSKESIGMGPGRTGVKGVIKDRDEANELQHNRSAQAAREKAAQWERGNLSGKTYLEEQREKALRNDLYGLEEKVDQLVLDELANEKASTREFDMFGATKRGRFGHLREVGVKGFVGAVEKEDRDTTLSQLARAHPETKFIRARASKLGFTSSSSSSRLSSSRTISAQPHSTGRIRTSRTLNTIDSDSDDDDPYADDDATTSQLGANPIRHDSYNEDEYGEDEEGDDDDDDGDVDLDMLPTMLVYRDGELVHNWVRVDWVAKESGGGGGGGGDGLSDGLGKEIEDLLERHHIFPHYGFRAAGDDEPSGDLGFSNNLGLPSDDDDDEEILWSD